MAVQATEATQAESIYPANLPESEWLWLAWQTCHEVLNVLYTDARGYYSLERLASANGVSGPDLPDLYTEILRNMVERADSAIDGAIAALQGWKQARRGGKDAPEPHYSPDATVRDAHHIVVG